MHSHQKRKGWVWGTLYVFEADKIKKKNLFNESGGGGLYAIKTDEIEMKNNKQTYSKAADLLSYPLRKHLTSVYEDIVIG